MKSLSMIVLLFAFCAGASDGSGAGAGTRGGGEGIITNEGVELRDLLDTGSCTWRSGEELLEGSLTALRRPLGVLRGIDWYFAAALRNEIRSLRFCFTGELVPLAPRPGTLPMASPSWEATQLAVREGQDVYVNETLYSRLSDESKAMLLIHEALHTFLPPALPHRDAKLRSIVRTIHRLAQARVISHEQVLYQFERNGLVFPRSSGGLQEWRGQIEFLLGSHTERVLQLHAHPDPAAFLAAYQTIPAHWLLSSHRDLLTSFSLTTVVRDALAMDNFALLGTLARSESLAKIILDLIDATPDDGSHPRVRAWAREERTKRESAWPNVL